MGNRAMLNAQENKNDEFYTQLTDIEQELTHYRKHFKGKTIFLNCDDPDISAFWQYFSNNFAYFGLKKLISTHYEEDEKATSYKLILEQQDTTEKPKVIKS